MEQQKMIEDTNEKKEDDANISMMFEMLEHERTQFTVIRDFKKDHSLSHRLERSQTDY
jgi:hypothetical protein